MEELQSFTKMQPFELKKPRIKKEIHYQLTNYLNQKDAIDATESIYIPSERVLELWKSDFERTNTIAAGYAYIECNLGRYDNRSISIALQLHKAIATSKTVEKEIDWFQLNRLVSRNISYVPDPIILNVYKSAYNKAYNSILQTFDMFPDELAKLWQICVLLIEVCNGWF